MDDAGSDEATRLKELESTDAAGAAAEYRSISPLS